MDIAGKYSLQEYKTALTGTGQPAGRRFFILKNKSKTSNR
jgi:hypothetical protein